MRTFVPLFKKTSAGRIQEWKIAVRKNKDGSGTILIEQGLVDGKKQQYEEQITEGKNLGKKNETSAFEQAVAEAEARWTKQKDRRHYGEDPTAEESAAKRSAAPMLAGVYQDHADKVDWHGALAQPKLDGNRCLAKMDGEGNVSLWTRKGVEIKTLGHLIAPLRAVMNPTDVLDGEVYVHGLHVTNLRSLLTRQQPDCETVSFRIYDQVSPLPFCQRWGYLQDLDLKVGVPRDGLCLVPTIKVMNEKELMKFQADCIAQGFEGAMLRWGKFGYQAGARSQGLLKVKTFKDAEFKILQVTTGTGPYADCAVFVCQAASGGVFNVTAPGSLKEKREIWKNGADYVGRLLTVKFAGYTETDFPVPFQPVALGIRED